MRFNTRLTIILILALAAFLRLWNLDKVGLNSDEAVYAGQAAALAGDQERGRFFSPFRAHPLLFQFLLSLFYRIEVWDIGARILAAAFDVGTVFLVYVIAGRLGSKNWGLIAALIYSVIPYTILVSRHALLDVPLTFFTAMGIAFAIAYLKTPHIRNLASSACALALGFLSKEVGLLAAIAVFVTLLLNRTSLRHLFLVSVLFLAIISVHPISASLAGNSGGLVAYSTWQFSRPPNHPPSYFAEVFVQYFGVPTIVLSLIGMVFLIRKTRQLGLLLILWVALFYVFFQFWSTKLFSYLLPVSPAIAVGTAYGIRGMWSLVRGYPIPYARTLKVVLPLVLILSASISFTITPAILIENPRVIFEGFADVEPEDENKYLAERGPVLLNFAGAKEAALWIRDNTLEDAEFLTIGPSMANIIKFYGLRNAYGLSVSRDPRLTNPAYEPVLAPDLIVASGTIRYVVYDLYSAIRSPYYAGRLTEIIQSNDVKLIHVEYVEDQEGRSPRVFIYEVKLP